MMVNCFNSKAPPPPVVRDVQWSDAEIRGLIMQSIVRTGSQFVGDRELDLLVAGFKIALAVNPAITLRIGRARRCGP